jgi:hypothetical protein
MFGSCLQTKYYPRARQSFANFDIRDLWINYDMGQRVQFLAILNYVRLIIRRIEKIRDITYKNIGEFYRQHSIIIRFTQKSIQMDDSWPISIYGNIAPVSMKRLFQFLFGVEDILWKSPQPIVPVFVTTFEVISNSVRKTCHNEVPPQDDSVRSYDDETCYMSQSQTEITFNYLDVDPKIERFETGSDSDKDFG